MTDHSLSLIVSYHEMRNARHAGRARPLTSAITEFMRYCGAWWTSSGDGWLRITDTRVTGVLDGIRSRLDHAEEEQAGREGPL